MPCAWCERSTAGRLQSADWFHRAVAARWTAQYHDTVCHLCCTQPKCSSMEDYEELQPLEAHLRRVLTDRKLSFLPPRRWPSRESTNLDGPNCWHMSLPPIQGGSISIQYLDKASRCVLHAGVWQNQRGTKVDHIIYGGQLIAVSGAGWGKKTPVAPKQTVGRISGSAVLFVATQHYAHARQQEQCIVRYLVLAEEAEASAPVGTQQQWSSRSSVHTRVIQA